MLVIVVGADWTIVMAVCSNSLLIILNVVWVSVSIAIEVVSSTIVLVVVDTGTSVSVKVNCPVLVTTTVVFLNVEVNIDWKELVLSPPDLYIVEVSVDASRIVVTLKIVEPATVIFLVDSIKVVEFLMAVDGGGVEVNVVVKVTTIGVVPQPEGMIEGPAGKQEPRPGY